MVINIWLSGFGLPTLYRKEGRKTLTRVFTLPLIKEDEKSVRQLDQNLFSCIRTT